MTAADWTTIGQPQDIRLVVADMDGTLLDERSRIPDGFWPMLARLKRRGVEFVPASGRQYATLRNMFADKAAEILDGKVVEVHGVDLDVTRHVIDLVDDAAASGEHNVGLVVCGLKSAYVQRSDKPFLDEVGKYYAALSIVDDLHEVLDFAQEPSAYTPDGDAEIVLKLAILDLDGSERFTNEKLTHLRADYQVVVSGKLWVDIMNIETDKKQGVEALQRVLGVTPAQTAVFGDYLNDLLMLEAGDWSFAMGNAHPDLKAAARYIAPSNVEHGVLKVVDRLVA